MIQRQLLTFGVVGFLGFCVDSGITMMLIALSVSPLLARVPAIAVAMAFTWLANRSLTFRVASPANHREAMRYGVVGVVSAILNYLIYTGMVLAGIHPLVAIVISTGLVTALSFFGYKRFAFSIN